MPIVPYKRRFAPAYWHSLKDIGGYKYAEANNIKGYAIVCTCGAGNEQHPLRVYYPLHIMSQIADDLIIDPSLLPDPPYPLWKLGCLFIGARAPVQLHTFQLINMFSFDEVLTGHQVLSSLVRSYQGAMRYFEYPVEADDPIHGHWGTRELLWLGQTWMHLPEVFRRWATGKRLFGYRDTLLDVRYNPRVATLDCYSHEVVPVFEWWSLNSEFSGNEYYLTGVC
jgi:hypothetical protein